VGKGAAAARRPRYDAGMRSRILLPALFLVAAGAFVLPNVTHAAIPFFGPIIPAGNDTCPAGWGMFMIVINNIVELLITLAIVFVAPLTIAWAGFLYVVNPVDPSGMSRAKSILWNTVFGIVIALAAWLIVDAILAALTNQGLTYWASLVGSNGTQPCLSVASSLRQAAPPTTTAGLAVGTTPTVTGVGAGGQQYLSFGSGACVATAVQQGATSGGYSLTVAQSNTLACIAQFESTCGSNLRPNPASSAAGAFQVLLQRNSACYNNAACEQAAGQPGVPLNCQNGFSGGQSLNNATSQMCYAAAANLACAASAAACLVQANPNFSDWATPSDQSCVRTYNI